MSFPKRAPIPIRSSTIKVEPDERDITFDDTVYQVKIFVTEEDGKLITNIVIYNQKTGYKYSPQGEGEPCSVTFVNDPTPTVPEETTVPTDPGETETPSGSDTPAETTTDDTSGSKSRPQTGDDFLLAIFASAGLFMLSVFYYRSVVKEVQKR